MGCNMWKANMCRLGVNCPLAHGQHELASDARGAQKKKEICAAFRSGKCTAGDRCQFSHNVKELSTGLWSGGNRGVVGGRSRSRSRSRSRRARSKSAPRKKRKRKRSPSDSSGEV